MMIGLFIEPSGAAGPTRSKLRRSDGEESSIEAEDSALYRHPEFDCVVWRIDQILLRTQVSFGRLDRSVAEQQLDLF